MHSLSNRMSCRGTKCIHANYSTGNHPQGYWWDEFIFIRISIPEGGFFKCTIGTRVHVCVCKQVFIRLLVFYKQKGHRGERCTHVSCSVGNQRQGYCWTWNFPWFLFKSTNLTWKRSMKIVDWSTPNLNWVSRNGRTSCNQKQAVKSKVWMSSSSPSAIHESLLRSTSSADNASHRHKFDGTATYSMPSDSELSCPTWGSQYRPNENYIVMRRMNLAMSVSNGSIVSKTADTESIDSYCIPHSLECTGPCIWARSMTCNKLSMA